MSNPDDNRQTTATPGVGVTPAALLLEDRRAVSFDVEVSAPAVVRSWSPPRDTPQGRMPASVTVELGTDIAREIESEGELLEGERLEIRYGKKIAVQSRVFAEIPVDYGGGLRGPLAVGSTGRLVACDADIGGWKRRGGIVFPELPTRHTFAHAIFMPGLRVGADLDYEVPTDERFIGSDDLAAGLALTGDDTSTEVRGLTIKLGADAAEPVLLGTSTLDLIEAAAQAAVGAAVPNDGGTAAFTAFEQTISLGRAAVESQKVSVE